MVQNVMQSGAQPARGRLCPAKLCLHDILRGPITKSASGGFLELASVTGRVSATFLLPSSRPQADTLTP